MTKSGFVDGIFEQLGAGLDYKPFPTRLGYHNANCVGCVHGGIGYWNKIRVDFPATFDRMALLEREIGFALHHDTSGPIWLDELENDQPHAPISSRPPSARENDPA